MTIPWCIARILPGQPTITGRCGITYQCVISILSFPLKITLAPLGPAIFASNDCAHVKVK
jgi:hypothetical protein